LAQGKPVAAKYFSQCYIQLQIEMNGLGASACMAFFSKIDVSSPLYTVHKKDAVLKSFYPTLLKKAQDTLEGMIAGKEKSTKPPLTLKSAHLYVSQIIHYFRVRCDFKRLKTLKNLVEQGLRKLALKTKHDTHSTLNFTFENLKRLTGFLPEDMQASVAQDKAVLQKQLAKLSKLYYQESKRLINAHRVLKHFDVAKALDQVCEACVQKAQLDGACPTQINPTLWKPLAAYDAHLSKPLKKSKNATSLYKRFEALILPYAQVRAAYDCLVGPVSKSISQYVKQAQSSTLYQSDLQSLLERLYDQQPILKAALLKHTNASNNPRLIQPQCI